MDVKERDQRVSSLKTQITDFRSNLKTDCADIIEQCKEDGNKDRQIKELQAEIDRLKSWLKKREDQLQALWANDDKDSETADPKPNVNDLTISLKFSNNAILERNRQIEELQITTKNHREQFDNLKAHFEVTLKAIAMNLNALKGARKPDETKDVDGVMVTFRNYDGSLTHHHKTIIIENVQRAIAEEAKKLKGANLKDFSFDDIPF
jgi:predicted RNase H-like nuclease (RuvC/YqgF family)